MSIVYDHPTIMLENDHVLEKIGEYIVRVSHAVAMGSYFVDIFTWLNRIPERSCLIFSLSYCEC